MIVPSMTFKEMFDDLVIDSEKVKIKIDYLWPKVIKQLQREKKFPTWRMYDYKIPSTNNKYVLFFFAKNKYDFENTHFLSLFANRERYIIRGMEMGYRHTENSELIMLPQVHIYTSHFIQRYNERFLHNNNLSANEIASYYFLRNKIPIPITLNKDINIKFNEYGRSNQFGFQVNDGFCFARTSLCGKIDENGNREKDQIDAMGIVFTTFLNVIRMHESQRDAIEKEHFEVLKRCIHELIS